MKNKTSLSLSLLPAVAAGVLLLFASGSRAASVNVFLDDGNYCPGSSNSGFPYVNGDRDATWDVTAATEPGLSALGASVMEVRMAATTRDLYSRYATTGGGSGLAVAEGGSAAWFDGTEAVFFQFTFFADAGKTTEITGVDITFKSITSRIVNGSPNLTVNAYATSTRPFTWIDGDSSGTLNDADYPNLAPYNMFMFRDVDAADCMDTALAPSGTPNNYYYVISGSDTVSFGEGDTFWLRRQNLNGQTDAAYQLGAVTFEMVRDAAKASDPDPAIGLIEAADSVVLGWTSGIGAVEHDVYVGTDATAVAAADNSDTSGIYRGRQSANSYAVGNLAEGDTVYWRIDEVDSGSNVTAGDVWFVAVQRDLYSDAWVATDALGRTLPGFDDCGGPRQNKHVGIFYFTWHEGDSLYYDITQILAENPATPFNDKNWGPEHAFHYWGQPEAGYYRITDEWVIRRHMSMLADAGVDFLFIDVTNGFTYEPQYLKLFEVMRAMSKEGLKVPKVCFHTYWKSPETIQTLYNELYSQNLYSDLWYYRDGKPLIFGQKDDPFQAGGYLDSEIVNFFTWRICWSEMPGQDYWQWQDKYPQRHGWHDFYKFPEQMSVGCALVPQWDYRGRSYRNGYKPPLDAYCLTGTEEQGYYFDEQWEQVETYDPEVVMITTWNEWIAQRFIASEGFNIGLPWLDRVLVDGDTHFIGIFNQEQSRDIEPMKDGHTDSYYYKMIEKIRKFKGMRKPEDPSHPKTMTIDGNFSDWTEVLPEYRDTVGDTYHRNAAGWLNAGIYVNNTGRNDLLDMKVARDTAYIFFYAKTREPLTSYTDPNWMLLFINADQDHSTGWQGYDYVINRSPSSGLTSLEYTSSGWNWTAVSSGIEYAASGNEIEIRVPRHLIGQGGGFDPVAFDFHWADNIQADDDIIEFAVSGDSAPNRRFNYRYQTREPIETTLLHNGFETGDPMYGDWDITTTEPYTGTHSLEGSSNDNIGISAHYVPTTGLEAFRVSFKYMLKNIDLSDAVRVYYHEYDTDAWTLIEEIGAYENNVWLQFTDVRFNSGDDAKFFDDTLHFFVSGGGVNAGGEYVYIDDLEITGYSSTEQPAPSPQESYAMWASTYGLDTNTTGAATYDAEYGGLGDGLNNLIEYMLGGNPTVDDAVDFMPAVAISDAGGGSNVIEYVYNRRLDATLLGLTYGLNLSTNLLSDWIYAGHVYESGTAAIDLYFESVTNAVPATNDAGFVSLKIQGDF